MHFSELTAPEQRVLGCLIEKRLTTPDGYPLSLNSLRLACNQSTNREPVTDYDEDAVYRAAQRLCQYGLARLASGHSSRATKYRHLAEDGLGIDPEAQSVLGVLLLRGAQTPGELKLRTERMAPLHSLVDVERVLTALGERGYVRRIPRRPGQKEDRFVHLLGEADLVASTVPAPSTPAPAAAAPAASAPAAVAAPAASATAGAPSPAVLAPAASDLSNRVAALEAEVAALREQLAELVG